MVKKAAMMALVSLGLAACSDDPEKLATCHGPIFALNTGHWQPQPVDLVKPKVAGANE